MRHYSSQYTATPTNFFAVFGVAFLIARVCYKPIMWYFEIHHRTFFVSEWCHDFFALRNVHAQHVYLQEESSPGVLLLKKRCEFVLIIFYLQVINSGHADSSMADKNHGKLFS